MIECCDKTRGCEQRRRSLLPGSKQAETAGFAQNYGLLCDCHLKSKHSFIFDTRADCFLNATMCQHARFEPDYFVPYSLLHSAVNKQLCNASPPLPILCDSQNTQREPLCNSSPPLCHQASLLLQDWTLDGSFLSPQQHCALNVFTPICVQCTYTCLFILGID